ncbi:methyltransferase [Roseivivax sp.]
MSLAAEEPGPRGRGARPGILTRMARLVAQPGFQRWAARLPFIRPHVRREGAEIFDLVQGFVASQTLLALIELRVLHRALEAPVSAEALTAPLDLPEDRVALLLQAGAALELLIRMRDGRYRISLRGAALLGVPGLEAMIRHHGAFYRDMADPVALLRGETETELAEVWPYVFGGAGGQEAVVRQYSDLMSGSQALVAEDTLAATSLRGVRHLLDIGGGHGGFARAVRARHPGLPVTVFDLPEVVASAPESPGLTFAGGSFRDDPLPAGCDAISLVRVLYDHETATVRALLAKVFEALPPGGRLIISEPMSGGARPDPHGDVYFAFYTLAMRTGRVRAPEEIGAILSDTGFSRIRMPRARRPFVTQVVTAVKTGV